MNVTRANKLLSSIPFEPPGNYSPKKNALTPEKMALRIEPLPSTTKKPGIPQ
jgi:hypothetical protein